MTNTNHFQGDYIDGDKVEGGKHDHHHYGERAAYTPPEPPPQGELAPHGSIPPNSRMELERNLYFVGREEELHQLAAALLYANDGEAQAITTHGIGGMGKSQLAVEYASRYGRFYAGGVYWVSFADGDGVAGEIAACGAQTAVNPTTFAALPLPEQAKQTVRGWGDGKLRLLIYDNCEEPALYKKWKPQKSGCRILLTSRRAVWDTHVAQTIKLNTLTTPQSVDLLRALIDADGTTGATDDVLKAIADEVGNLPLALHLAGSYLHFYRHSETAESYLQQMREQMLQHDSMHGEETGDSPTNHTHSLTLTIKMSADKLGATATDSVAKTLLTRLAYLAPGEPTGRDLLLEFAGMNAEQKKERDKALRRLLELGLLEAEAGGAVKLHRTIAAYAQAEWGNDGVQAAVAQAAFIKSYEDNASGWPARMAAWLPHMRHITTAALTRNSEGSVPLANNLGSHLNVVGDYTGAIILAERALTISEAQLGSEHLLTAYSLSNLATSLRTMGQHEKARPLAERALTIKEKQFGSEHPETAVSLNNLALLLWTTGEYGEAQPLAEHALAIAEKQLGLEHPQTAVSLNNLAGLLQAMGQYEEARPLAKRALAINEKVFGHEHLRTAGSLNNLAWLLQAMGEDEEARPLSKRAFVIVEKQFGSEHLNTIKRRIALYGYEPDSPFREILSTWTMQDMMQIAEGLFESQEQYFATIAQITSDKNVLQEINQLMSDVPTGLSDMMSQVMQTLQSPDTPTGLSDMMSKAMQTLQSPDTSMDLSDMMSKAMQTLQSPDTSMDLSDMMSKAMQTLQSLDTSMDLSDMMSQVTHLNEEE